jgi:DNA helicase HerA-like ATPase
VPRIVVLDPHNEYSKAFGEKHIRLSTDEGSLKLPYWLLNFQETVSLIIGKTEFVATSQSNIVKLALLNSRTEAAGTLGIDLTKQPLTVDSPTPYSIQKFKDEVNQQRPPGKDKKEQEPFNSVINKLETLQRDSRMNFMLSPWDGTTDDFAPVLSQFVGVGKAVRIVDLSGVPNEVAGICSAVIARTLFNLKVWQTSEERERDPVLMVCEEAHRYVPNRGEAQYEAAQEAIRRIAKEGRKYGIGLLLVSQRPSEVEATVLSQCNSWIILRITNDADREHVRAILPDSMAGLTKMLSGLRRQEAIFVGQAAILPSRILIRSLTQEQLPRSNDIDFDKGWQSASMTDDELGVIANRWRFQQR